MDIEFNALQDNNTWKLVPFTYSMNILGNKFARYNNNNSFIKLKLF